jgi:hypothetical protein
LEKTYKNNMPRQQKPCTFCGTPVDIVPAGVSKRTGKPYGSFAACKACGKTEQIGTQPPRAPRTQQGGGTSPVAEEMIKLLRDNNRMLKDVHAAYFAQAKSVTIDPNDLPFNG